MFGATGWRRDRLQARSFAVGGDWRDGRDDAGLEHHMWLTAHSHVPVRALAAVPRHFAPWPRRRVLAVTTCRVAQLHPNIAPYLVACSISYSRTLSCSPSACFPLLSRRPHSTPRNFAATLDPYKRAPRTMAPYFIRPIFSSAIKKARRIRNHTPLVP